MPPRRFSRHTYALGIHDAADPNVLLLTDREPYRYRPLSDNVTHVVREGESLMTLAGKYFQPLARPAGLYWVIADFQPDPILDPTIALVPGTVLVVPSLRTVTEQVFSEQRRDEG